MSRLSSPLKNVSVAVAAAGEAPSRPGHARRRSDRRHLALGLLAMDVCMLVLAFLCTYIARSWFRSLDSMPLTAEVGLPAAGILLAGYVVLYHLHGLYHSSNLFWGSSEYQRVFGATGTAILFALALTAVYSPFKASPGWLLTLWSFTLAFGLAGRFLVRRIVYSNRKRGRFVERTLVLGANSEGIAVAEQLREHPASGALIVGFVDNGLSPGSEPIPGAPVLGGTAAFPALVKSHEIDAVVVADPSILRENLLSDEHALATLRDVEVQMAWGAFELLTTGLRIREEGFVPLVVLNKTRISGVHWLLKEVLDRVISFVALVVLLPFGLVLGALIKLDSRGPVFHRRRVIGVGRKPFDAFKLRTMRVEGDSLLSEEQKREWAEHGKIRNDPRITKLGAFLRKYSVDELPQLFNVLRGEMSIVGPRMLTEGELERFGPWQHSLLTVKPGMTGLWQVGGRSDLSYEDRVRMDLHYIRNHSIWLDLQILIQTVPALFSGRGAY